MRERGAAIDRVGVVIPARDEQDTVAAAVRAVRASAAALPPAVRVDVVVVADGCRDDTASRARAAGATVLEIAATAVGTARRTGCRWALQQSDDPRRLWIATTDADSVVPRGWLTAHLEASRCSDAFLGTIELAGADGDRYLAWAAEYASRVAVSPAGRAHDHVHGASLGVRGSAYLLVGEFRELSAHEDLDLVDRLVATGVEPVRDAGVPVLTSARHDSRVVEGVGPDLAASVAGPRPRSACMKSASPGT